MGNARNLAFWVVLFVLVISLFNLFGNGQNANTNERSYSEFVQAVEAGAVAEASGHEPEADTASLIRAALKLLAPKG